jgi:hypothetical protein
MSVRSIDKSGKNSQNLDASCRFSSKPKAKVFVSDHAYGVCQMHTDSTKYHWIEMLICAFDLGISDTLNIEWLIDKAEAGEWSDLWW